MTWEFFAGHWSFIAFSCIAAVLMQVLKSTVWSPRRILHAGFLSTFLWWERKTLPLHPVFLGCLVGLIPGIPAGGFDSRSMASRVLYYATAGLMSTWVYNVIKTLAKRKGASLPELLEFHSPKYASNITKEAPPTDSVGKASDTIGSAK
jgi:hypothetical protein